MSVDIGFIGAGGIASTHLRNLESRDTGDVVAICDIDEAAATAAAEPHDAAVFTEFSAMYEAVDLDAVFICVPPFAHGDAEREAIEHGIDLLIEKPLALQAETAREIEAAIDDAGVLSQVGHMTRYADIVERAEELIGDRPLALVDGHWWGGVPGTAWWRVKAQSGGQVVEQATHTYDIVRYFAGDIARVLATGSQQVVTESIDFEDATSASMLHADGTTSHVSASSASPAGKHGVQLIGEDFSLELDFRANTLTGVVGGDNVDYEGSGETYGPELDAFLEAVETRDGSDLRSPYGDARQTFEATLAVNESIETGDPVDVEVLE